MAEVVPSGRALRVWWALNLGCKCSGRGLAAFIGCKRDTASLGLREAMEAGIVSPEGVPLGGPQKGPVGGPISGQGGGPQKGPVLTLGGPQKGPGWPPKGAETTPKRPEKGAENSLCVSSSLTLSSSTTEEEQETEVSSLATRGNGQVDLFTPQPGALAKPVVSTVDRRQLGYPPEFCDWWKLYPKKVHKAEASKAFIEVIKTKKDLLVLCQNTLLYGEWCRAINRKMQDPATFLRSETWVDGVPPREDWLQQSGMQSEVEKMRLLDL